VGGKGNGHKNHPVFPSLPFQAFETEEFPFFSEAPGYFE
jgi:hypothetical protein